MHYNFSSPPFFFRSGRPPFNDPTLRTFRFSWPIFFSPLLSSPLRPLITPIYPSFLPEWRTPPPFHSTSFPGGLVLPPPPGPRNFFGTLATRSPFFFSLSAFFTAPLPFGLTRRVRKTAVPFNKFVPLFSSHGLSLACGLRPGITVFPFFNFCFFFFFSNPLYLVKIVSPKNIPFLSFFVDNTFSQKFFLFSIRISLMNYHTYVVAGR